MKNDRAPHPEHRQHVITEGDMTGWCQICQTWNLHEPITVTGSPSVGRFVNAPDYATVSDCLDIYVGHETAAGHVGPYVIREGYVMTPLTLDREYQYHVEAASWLRRVVLG